MKNFVLATVLALASTGALAKDLSVIRFVRNFGFSDAAEIFVFLAGYAAVLAYGKIALRDGYLIAGVKILRRAWVLYVVHPKPAPCYWWKTKATAA